MISVSVWFYFSSERMKTFKISSITLLGLCVILSEDHSGCCLDTVWEPPRPSISHLRAVSGRQSLMVSWLVNHSSLAGDINEIQISRPENHTVIYNVNVSAPSAGSREHTWTWTSDLPLECVDHSVRIRHFYNQSGPGPWSEWVTNYGVEAKEKTETFPSERILREGTSATFCCVPPAGVSITSMTLSRKEYPLISIGARVKAITEHNLTIPKTFINALLLSCGDSTGKISHIWNFVSSPPQKPKNITCATSHMTTVTCSWDPDRNRHPNDQNKQTHTLHIKNSDQAPVNCEPSSCTFPAIPQLEEYNIIVAVKDQLGEEMESYSFNILDRVFPVVEWDRVNPGVTDTTMSWIVQGNLTQLNVVCQATVDPDSTTELNCINVGGLCKVKLEHLLPNTRYSTRVRCSVNGRLWGKWTQPRFFTTYPLVTLNLWRRIKQMSSDSRQVTLLWTQHVPGSATTVAIQGYTVHWSQEGQNRTEWKTLSGHTQAEVSIGPGQYDFTVQAVLHTGLSVPARITVPKLDDRENPPVETRLNSGPAGGFSLSWTEQDTATCGYTVEWCIQENTKENTMPCTLRWIKMPAGNNTLFLPARNFKAGCRYTFNIYGCTENGHRLLEIQTGYSQELRGMLLPSLAEPVQSTFSSVTLEWHYNEDDPAHLAFITGYLVTVQEVGSNMLPGHTANMFNVTVADPRTKSVSINGLKESQEYAFSVSALSKEGPGQAASITFRTRTNYPAHFAMRLTCVLLLLVCAVLVWHQRKMLTRRLKEIFVYPAGMNIKISELDSFLHETGERVYSHRVEECISCEIEILNNPPPLKETTTPRDPEPLKAPPSPGPQSSASSLSPSCVPPQDYCPQSPVALCKGPALQQITCFTNKSYFPSVAEDTSEPQEATSSEIKSSFGPSDCPQEPCLVIYGYISNDTL